MYGYEEPIYLNSDLILQKVSQEDIFKIVFKQNIELDIKQYTNPIRNNDNHPGCYFELYNNEVIHFIDFADKVTHRTCFRMIMDAYKVSYREALNIICKYYKLSNNLSDYDTSVIYTKSYKHESSIIEKQPFQIKTEEREFNKKDILWWSQYLIRPEHLIEDNVSAINKYSLFTKGSWKTITPFTLCYDVYNKGDKHKLYKPYDNHKYRFMTNCTNDDIGNWDNLPNSMERLVVTKSYKDHRVLRNTELISNIAWFQNEGQVPSEEVICKIIDRCGEIVFFYDNDDTGLIASKKLVEVFNYHKPNIAKEVHLPVRKYKWKDPSDFLKKEGRQDLVKVLKYIKLINGKNS